MKQKLTSEREEVNRLMSSIACCADLMNTWARELSVEQCLQPYTDFGLRDLADRLWAKSSAMRKANDR